MSSVDDVVDEVPEHGEDDQKVADPEESYPPGDGLWYLVGVKVKQIEAARVVVIIPVYFFGPLHPTFRVVFGRHVLHVFKTLFQIYLSKSYKR